MFNPTSNSELLLFSTVRIETINQNGEISKGTGFFFDFNTSNNQTLKLLLTNKHVIRGGVFGKFLIHSAVSTSDQTSLPGTSVEFNLDNFESRWYLHPDDSVDLCALIYEPSIFPTGFPNFHAYINSIPNETIHSDQKLFDLWAIEDVVMLGYPIGLWDEVNNLPLIRKGITASHPAIDFNGQSRGVVDMACFPGSSGSPILILKEGYFANKFGGFVQGNSLILLGLLFAGPQYTVQGDIEIQEIPTTSIPISQTPIMIHLGYYVKAKEILVLGNLIEENLRSRGFALD